MNIDSMLKLRFSHRLMQCRLKSMQRLDWESCQKAKGHNIVDAYMHFTGFNYLILHTLWYIFLNTDALMPKKDNL